MALIDKDQICAEIERRLKRENEILWNAKKRGTYPSPSCEYNLLTLTSLRDFLDSLPEQPVSDHHEIEVEFRGERVTISREFYRNGKMNYSTSEQDDNAIWSALRSWCEKKGITPFELYPKQPEQPVENPKKGVPKYPLSVIADLLGSTPPGPVVFVPEQPAEGLEEAAQHSEILTYPMPEDGDVEKVMKVQEARIFHEIGFKAGAEWQKKLDDLETADLLAIAHLQGMEQQKAKMLEDAVEGEVTTDNRGNNVARAGVFNKDFEYGDKVKIIIVKEDEK